MKLYVVLVEPEGPVNIGLVARVSVNFGVEELRLVNPKASIKEALRYAAKASSFLSSSKIYGSLSEALSDVDLSVATTRIVGGRRDVLRHPVTPWEAAEVAQSYEKVALVFGRESVGLTRDEINMCDLVSTIPANPEYPVLNLSHAVVVYLYEFWKARNVRTHLTLEHASAKEMNLIECYIKEIAEAVIRDKRRVEDVVTSFKHALTKAKLTTGEAMNILYLLRKIYVRVKGHEADTEM